MIREKFDYLFEETVINKMNETNLEYIGIYGLFGRYTIEIPFDKQVNIFIGENGLGKTTILNCIYFVLEKKFSRLMNIQFSEIQIKFRKDPKFYSISLADIKAYNRGSQNSIFFNYINHDIIKNDFVDGFLHNHDENLSEIKSEIEIDDLAYELSRRIDVPMSYARERVYQYFNDKEIIESNKRKADRKNVVQLMKAISENVTHRIIYLPTYRRIEDDFATLNLQSEELNKAELLIRFGMSDVQSSIERILKKIRSLAMEGFTEMTGILLKQYVDGVDPIQDMDSIRSKYYEVKEETVKIVLDRVGEKIEQSYKEKILNLIKSGDIWQYEYFYLLNFITKLIENYDLQKAYDDRIKKFADTCNKYLNDKHFDYNQSTLNLEIHLDSERNKDKKVIALTQLSSGEKQIVSLFSKLYLESDERSIIIIDEPELSLSLNWQKMLIPDIMRTENCDLLLTVTHSPFIFQNEFDFDAKEIRQYIKKYK